MKTNFHLKFHSNWVKIEQFSAILAVQLLLAWQKLAAILKPWECVVLVVWILALGRGWHNPLIFSRTPPATTELMPVTSSSAFVLQNPLFFSSSYSSPFFYISHYFQIHLRVFILLLIFPFQPLPIPFNWNSLPPLFSQSAFSQTPNIMRRSCLCLLRWRVRKKRIWEREGLAFVFAFVFVF